jgi:hypothetical protein
LSADDFAEANGLGSSSLYTWRTRFRDTATTRAEAQATEGDRNAVCRTVRFTPVHVAQSSRGHVDSRIEIVTRGGVLVRVHGEVASAALRVMLATADQC